MTDAETIRTVCWTVTILFAIQAGSLYFVVKLLTTGRAAMFDRKPQNNVAYMGSER